MIFDIETFNLTKNFGDFAAVRGVDLRVPKGMIFGFLGKKGSSKSTTVKMLAEILSPSSGKAIDGGFILLGKNLAFAVSPRFSALLFVSARRLALGSGRRSRRGLLWSRAPAGIFGFWKSVVRQPLVQTGILRRFFEPLAGLPSLTVIFSFRRSRFPRLVVDCRSRYHLFRFISHLNRCLRKAFRAITRKDDALFIKTFVKKFDFIPQGAFKTSANSRLPASPFSISRPPNENRPHRLRHGLSHFRRVFKRRVLTCRLGENAER